MIKVTVWNEYLHELQDEAVAKIYPEGIHKAIGSYLEGKNFEVTYATLREEHHGLSDEVLENTDVLIWWGHIGHREVSEEIAEKVCERVLSGMGIIFLHSAPKSKPFMKLLGTTGSLRWRESDDRSLIWAVKENHPILAGVENPIVLEKEEMYGESFDIPTPSELVAISSFSGGEVFRSLCVWEKGRGKMIYFQPGHETYPAYYDKSILKVIENSVNYVKPTSEIVPLVCKNTMPVK